MSTFYDDKSDKRITELYKKEEEELIQMLSKKYSIPYLDLSGISIETDALRIIPEAEARSASVAAFKAAGKKLYVGVLSPNKEETIAVLENLKKKGLIVSLYLVSKQSLERAWGRYKDLSFASETKAGILDISHESLEELIGTVQSPGDVKRIVEETILENKGHKISKMLEIILAGAISTGASDIHIEPEETNVRLRYRLDGVLHDVLFFDFETNRLLNSRIKLVSGLKLTVKKNAQDGRFSVTISGKEIEMRVSLIPGTYGESTVLRILNPDSINVGLNDLGMSDHLLQILEQKIARPNGIILVTGPTGSGKTTTLYACLRKIHTEDIKMITIEDPVEYHLNGITQTQVEEEKGYTFANGLRSVLRQDPDVIMVGEIRDGDTAATAINAALTGHLVFSTLHTNNAAGTIPRLIDLGVNPKVLSSSLTMALAQRLVRKLCEKCKKKVAVSSYDQEIIRRIIAKITAEDMVYAIEGIDTDPKELFEAVGCDACNGIGYKGRIGIHEAILMDDKIEEIVNQFPSEREIRVAALPQKIPSMQEDVMVKILKGITTLDEAKRVVDFYE